MGVWLDGRSGSGDLLKYFPRGFAELCQLNSGDVMGVGNGPAGSVVWGIEVKKLSDCLGSLQSGRLAEQLGKMQEDYDLKLFLLEADMRMHVGTGRLQHRVRREKDGKRQEFWADVKMGVKKTIGYQHFHSWLFSVLLCSGTMFLHTTSREETACAIVSVERQLAKAWDEHSSLKVFNDAQGPGLFIPSVPMKVARDMAEMVGWEKAAAASEHFKTVRAMANATAEQWIEVEGFDKVLAQRMVEGATVPHVLRKRTRRAVKKEK